jgi:hypothetical protein
MVKPRIASDFESEEHSAVADFRNDLLRTDNVVFSILLVALQANYEDA